MKIEVKISKAALLDTGFVTMLLMMVFVLMFTMSSCNNNRTPASAKELATEKNDDKFIGAKQVDADFLVAAAGINLEEIQLGQLAQTNAMMPDVRELGVMMETDHKKALEALQVLAEKKQITLPKSLVGDGLSTYKKLNAEKGAHFDKEYCNLMVDGHNKAIETFTKASNSTEDADIRLWANAMIPILEAHLASAIDCQKKCKG
jgi:putative membrane protein